jgi:hypothetical protein
LNFLGLLDKKLANQKWISSKCEYLSKINQGSRQSEEIDPLIKFNNTK